MNECETVILTSFLVKKIVSFDLKHKRLYDRLYLNFICALVTLNHTTFYETTMIPKYLEATWLES